MRVATITIGLVAAFLIACGKPEDKFVGTYTGEYHMNAREQERFKAMPQEDQDAFNGLTVRLELHENKTALIDYGEERGRIRGFWRYEGSQVHVTFKQPGPRSIHFTVTNDFKTLSDGRWVFNKEVS